jgi:hypothetical protein
MRKIGVSALAASVVAGVMLLLAPPPASAATMPGSASAAPADAAMVEKVGSHRSYRPRSYRSRGRERSRSYDRRYHGGRSRYRSPGFTFHYGGYYYANPWWLGPSIGFGVTVPVTPVYPVMSAHAQYCLNRFQTYDIGTDTYVPRIGVRARCISPYPPPW